MGRLFGFDLTRPCKPPPLAARLQQALPSRPAAERDLSIAYSDRPQACHAARGMSQCRRRRGWRMSDRASTRYHRGAMRSNDPRDRPIATHDLASSLTEVATRTGSGTGPGAPGEDVLPPLVAGYEIGELLGRGGM